MGQASASGHTASGSGAWGAAWRTASANAPLRPGDDLDVLGPMVLQPGHHGGGFAVGQHVYYTILFQVHHDGSVADAAAEREIVNSQDPQGRVGRFASRYDRLAHQTQQRVAARSSGG